MATEDDLGSPSNNSLHCLILSLVPYLTHGSLSKSSYSYFYFFKKYKIELLIKKISTSIIKI